MSTLEKAQNADGGWPYERGHGSWTEPSVFALLSGLPKGSAKRGFDWLRSTQNLDGGWSPQPRKGPSTWVTALAALLLPETLGNAAHRRCVNWLLAQTGQESGLAHRVRQWMLGNQRLSSGAEKGWPWYPGASAWVMPTALSLVALRKQHPSGPVRQRIDGGTQYLLVHACKEGGWNHGSTHALGYESNAYPETTGVALLGLRGVKSREVECGIAVAEKFCRQPNPAGAAWLRIGLMAQGRPAPSIAPPVHPWGANVLDQALQRLSENPDVLFE